MAEEKKGEKKLTDAQKAVVAAISVDKQNDLTKKNLIKK